MNNKQYYVGYWDETIKKNINKIIKKHKLEREFDIAVNNLKRNAMCGNKISRDRWPKKYRKNQKINNLWRYELSKRKPGWRLIYTILPKNNIKILSALLDVLNHHRYDRVFGY